MSVCILHIWKICTRCSPQHLCPLSYADVLSMTQKNDLSNAHCSYTGCGVLIVRTLQLICTQIYTYKLMSHNFGGTSKIPRSLVLFVWVGLCKRRLLCWEESDFISLLRLATSNSFSVCQVCHRSLRSQTSVVKGTVTPPMVSPKFVPQTI